MNETYKDFVKKFRKRKTSALLKGYNNYNPEFRKIARDEFKKRGVGVKKLPYKKKPRRQNDMFAYLGNF